MTMNASDVVLSGIVAVVLCLTFGVASADEVKGVVTQLNAKNFNSNLKEGAHFVMFFAPWCGHCQALHPTWEKLAKKYNEAEDKQVNIASIDCDANEDICDKNKVEGYPTLKFFKPSVKVGVKHKGQRSLDALDNFVQAQLQAPPPAPEPSSKSLVKILYAANIDAHLTRPEAELTFVKFMAPWCGFCQSMAPDWQDLAKHYEEEDRVSVAKVDCTVDASVCTDHDVHSFPTIKLFVDGSKMGEKYEGGRTFEDFRRFLDKKLDGEEASAALEKSEAMELTKANFHSSIGQGLNFVKFYAPWCGHCQDMAPVWDEMAKAARETGEMKVARIDCTKEENSELCDKEGVEGYPTLFLYRDGKKLGRDFDGENSVAGFREFVADRLAGKPQPPPEEDEDEEEEKNKDKKDKEDKEDEDKEDEEEDKEDEDKEEGNEEAEQEEQQKALLLTQTNFAQHLKRPGAVLTFVKFMAPWCGHCKKLAPAWDDLAKHFHKTTEGVTIAKVDCTVEPEVCVDHDVKAYPTLKIYEGSDDNGSRFEGKRSLDDLKSFVRGILKKKGVKEIESKVLVLTKTNFESTVASGVTFVKFLSPWCGHCQELAPVWEKLANSEPDFKVAKLDCTKTSEEDLCESSGVDAFPTLYVFSEGKRLSPEFLGERNVEAMKRFVRETVEKGVEAPPPGEEEEEEEEVKEDEEDDQDLAEVYHLKKDTFKPFVSTGVTFVKFYAPWCGHCQQLAPTWKQLAAFVGGRKARVVKVDCTKTDDLCEKHGILSFPTLVIFKDGKKVTDYDGDRSLGKLKTFLAKFVDGPLDEGVEEEGADEDKDLDDKEVDDDKELEDNEFDDKDFDEKDIEDKEFEGEELSETMKKQIDGVLGDILNDENSDESSEKIIRVKTENSPKIEL